MFLTSGAECRPSFFEFVEHRIGADAQYPCRIANAAAIQGHVDNLRFDLG
jgi:hypothetical protein